VTAARIIVWRHGRTEWNQTSRFQGQADVELDSLGVLQAKRAAQVLATYSPAAIVASDLSRAVQTAQALAEVTGLPISTDRRLREIHVGSWEGLTGAELRAADPEMAAKLYAGEDVRRSATGESVSEVGERTAAALTDIAAASEDGSTVVVATHGLAGRAGISRLVGLPPASWRLLGSLDNCCWSMLEWHRGGGYWRVASYNVSAAPGMDTIS
jgi:broad specificity phosphatase PhoE